MHGWGPEVKRQHITVIFWSIALVMASTVVFVDAAESGPTPVGPLNEKATETVLGYIGESQEGHLLKPVSIDSKQHFVVVVKRDESRDEKLSYTPRDMWRRPLMMERYWKVRDTDEVLVFEEAGDDVRLVTNESTIRKAISAKAMLGWHTLLDTPTPDQWTVGFQKKTLNGEYTQLYFVGQKHGLTGQLKSEEDRYLAALQAMAMVNSDVPIIPSDVEDRLKSAESASSAASTALSLAEEYEAHSCVEVAGEKVSSDRVKKALRTFADDIEYIEKQTDEVTYAAGTASLVLALAEQKVYSDKRVRMLSRIQKYSSSHSDVSIDPALNRAIDRLEAMNDDVGQKTREALVKWFKEEGVQWVAEGGKVVARKFGSWLVTKSSYAVSVGSWATSGTAGVLLSTAASAASAGAIGWQLGGIVTGRSGIYSGMKKAEYSRFALQEFSEVNNHIVDTYGGDLSQSDSHTVYSTAAAYRASAYFEFKALTEFYGQVEAAMRSSYMDEMINNLESLYNHFNSRKARNEQAYVADLESDAQWVASKLSGPTLPLVLDNYPSGSVTVETPPDKPTVVAPTPGSSGVETATMLDWSGGDEDGDAVTYDVYLSKGSTNPSELVAENTTKTSLDVSLESGSIYYWKVVAFDEDGTKTVSQTWAFTTVESETTAPEVGQPSPEDGQSGVAWDTTLSWSGSSSDGSVTYQVYFGQSSDPGYYETTTSTSVDVSGLEEDTTYYWQVVADDGTTQKTSPVWEFSTGDYGSISVSDVSMRPVEMDGGHFPAAEEAWVEYNVQAKDVDGAEEYDVRVINQETGVVIGMFRGSPSDDQMEIITDDTLFRQPGQHDVKVIFHHSGTGKEVTASDSVSVSIDDSEDDVHVLPANRDTSDTITLDAAHLSTDTGGNEIDGYQWSVIYKPDEDPELVVDDKRGSSIQFDPVSEGEYRFIVENTGSGYVIDDRDFWVEGDEVEPDVSVSSITLSDTSPVVGQKVTATAEVRNEGEVEGNFLVRYIVDGKVVEIEITDVDGEEDGEAGTNSETEVLPLPEGQHTVKVEVVDSHNNLVEKSWSVDVRENRAPEVPSSPTPSVDATGVTTDASLSWSGGDPDGDSVTYSVYLEKGDPTPDTVVSNTSSTSTTVSLTPGATYYWKVEAVDEYGSSTQSDVWTFSTEAANTAPSARATARPVRVPSGETVTLDASRTSDAEGDALSYSWSQTSGPEVSLDNSSAAVTRFVAPSVTSQTTLSFVLAAVDDDGAENSTTVEVTIVPPLSNERPTADAGEDRTVFEQSTVALDGSLSMDPDGDTLNYSWVQTQGPSVTLRNPDTVTPRFVTPDVTDETTVTFELTVDDGNGGKATDRVSVTVRPCVGPRDAVDSNDDGRISQSELDSAVRAWRTGEEIPGLCTGRLTDVQMLDLLSSTDEQQSVHPAISHAVSGGR